MGTHCVSLPLVQTKSFLEQKLVRFLKGSKSGEWGYGIKPQFGALNCRLSLQTISQIIKDLYLGIIFHLQPLFFPTFPKEEKKGLVFD